MTVETRAPLTPAECDLAGHWMPLHIDKLEKSKAWLFATMNPAVGFYMVNLWAAAWLEVPAASLEDDDLTLAGLAKCRDMDTWRAVRQDALRGFVKCSDGRLYHEFMAPKALEAWLQKLGQRISSGHGNASRYKVDFDDTALREQKRIALEMLAQIAPTSSAFSKSHGVSSAKKERKPRAAKAAKPASPKGKVGDLPTGSHPESDRGPDGIATKLNQTKDTSLEDKSSKEGAEAPRGDDSPGGMPAGEMPDQGEDSQWPAGGPEGGEGGQPPADVPKDGAKAAPRPRVVLADRTPTLPDWLVPHASSFARFEASRWEGGARRPYTLRAQEGIVRQLDRLRAEGQDLTACLDASVRNGWTDVYAQKGGARRPAPAAQMTGRDYRNGGDLEVPL